MGEPIRSRRLGDLAGAPTPQNTPATAASSFAQRAAASRPTVAPIAEEASALAGLSNNPALLSMIQGKLNTLVGRPSGYVESLPRVVRDRLAGLRAIQDEHSKLEYEFLLELVALEKKYFTKYEPLYKRRAQIVSGEIEPTEDEIEKGHTLEKEDGDGFSDDDEERIKEVDEDAEGDGKDHKAEEQDEEEEEEDAKDVKGIPQFWLTAMKTFSLLGDMITGRDDEALQHLRDIRMEYLEQPGFALLFEFDENPFFSNKVLRKTYYYREEAGYDGEFVYDHAEGDEINWKSPENNLTVRIEKRKQRNKHTGATRTIEKTYPTESFFTFFSPPVDDEEGDDEDLEALEGQLQLDYEIGEFFKDKLIPHAVDWFTGRALDFEEDGYEDDEELYEDELDEDDDEEESSDDDDDDESGAANTTAKQGEQPSDCKQT